jgi:hypothetical protein
MAGACFALTGVQNPLATCLFRTNSDSNPPGSNATSLGFDCTRLDLVYGPDFVNHNLLGQAASSSLSYSIATTSAAAL